MTLDELRAKAPETADRFEAAASCGYPPDVALSELDAMLREARARVLEAAATDELSALDMRDRAARIRSGELP